MTSSFRNILLFFSSFFVLIRKGSELKFEGFLSVLIKSIREIIFAFFAEQSRNFKCVKTIASPKIIVN